MRRQHKILVTTKLGRPDAARVAVKLEEAHDGAYADPALLGSFRYRSAGINRLDHARSQVLRIRLRHPCWPPPAGSLNQIRCGVKIPDSAFSGNALTQSPVHSAGACSPPGGSQPKDKSRSRADMRMRVSCRGTVRAVLACFGIVGPGASRCPRRGACFLCTRSDGQLKGPGTRRDVAGAFFGLGL